MSHWFKQSNCVQEDLDIERLTWAKRKCEAGEDERETETEWSSERVSSERERSWRLWRQEWTKIAIYKQKSIVMKKIAAIQEIKSI